MEQKCTINDLVEILNKVIKIFGSYKMKKAVDILDGFV